MKPPRSILDRAFKWVPPANTDVAATFARIRRENRALAESTRIKVTPLKARKP